MYSVREPRVSGTLDTVLSCVISYSTRTRAVLTQNSLLHHVHGQAYSSLLSRIKIHLCSLSRATRHSLPPPQILDTTSLNR